VLNVYLHSLLTFLAASDTVSTVPVSGPGLDPVHISDTVRITAYSRSKFLELGRSCTIFDLSPELANGLDLMLSQGVFLKQYGVGGSSTIGRRGADATQTQVVWNGLPVNNPMLGMADFFNQQAGSMDRVELVEGGASTLIGSGSVGGTLYLNQFPHYGSKPVLQAFSEFGQFGRQSQLIKLQKGTSTWYSSTTLNHRFTRNDFAFFDPVWGENRTMDQASTEQWGWNQHLAFRPSPESPWSINAKAEQLVGERGLGQMWGRSAALGVQNDQTFRWVIESQYQSGIGVFLLRSGQTQNRIQFQDGVASTNHWDSSRSVARHLQLEYHVAVRDWEILAGQDALGIDAQTPTYQQEQAFLASFVALNRHSGPWHYSLQSRVEWVERLPTYSLSIERDVASGQMRFNAHSSFRRPTFNDRFWNAEPTTVLTPETGLGTEWGWHSALADRSMKWDWVVYARELNAPILWLPTQAGFWQAQNLWKSRFVGLQGSWQWRWNHWEFHQRWDAVRSWLWASEQQAKPSQQVFVPNLNGVAALHYSVQSWRLGLRINHTGKRFVQTDNASALPAYQLVECQVQYQRASAPWALTLGSENLTNVDYQNMPGRPMPPRTIYFSIVYHPILTP